MLSIFQHVKRGDRLIASFTPSGSATCALKNRLVSSLVYILQRGNSWQNNENNDFLKTDEGNKLNIGHSI